MKSKLIALILSISVILPLHAVSPCHNSFAIAAAYLHVEYLQDMSGCDDMFVFTGPCRDEATAKYNQGIHRELKNFSQCCCLNQLACCG